MKAKTIIFCSVLVLIILIAVIPTAQSQATSLAGNPDMTKDCLCTAIYCPVCGSDGITYPSICALRCQSQSQKGLKCVCGETCESSDNCKMSSAKPCPKGDQSCPPTG